MSGERVDAASSSGARLGSDCLSAELIDAVLGGMLEPSERTHSHAHVATCPACVERLTRAGEQIFGGSLGPGRLVARRYRILRFVAQGGMGEVYEAYDTELSVRVALKMVPATGEQGPAALAREVLLARSIAHPNVCRIFDLGLHEGDRRELPLRFLTMEFVDGERLSAYIAGGPMELGLVHGIARDLLLGLGAAHRAGVLHRDFKSDNVLLREGITPVPQAVILDFGLARSLGRHGAHSSVTHHRVEGSLYYMAPEQLRGQALGWETDVYGFGVVLFEMLTGRTPFEAQITLGAALQRCSAPPPRASALVPTLPSALEQLVQRCLSPERAERYQSAEATLAALDRAFAPALTFWSQRGMSLLAGSSRTKAEHALTRAPLLIGFMTLAGLGREADQLPVQPRELALTPAPPSVAQILAAASSTPSPEPHFTSAASPSAASAPLESEAARVSTPTARVPRPASRAVQPAAPGAPPTVDAVPSAVDAVPPAALAVKDRHGPLVSDLPPTDDAEQAPAESAAVPDRDRGDTSFEPFMAERGVDAPAGASD